MDFAAAAVREPEELLPSEGCRTLKFPRDERLCEKKIQLLDTGTGKRLHCYRALETKVAGSCSCWGIREHNIEQREPVTSNFDPSLTLAQPNESRREASVGALDCRQNLRTGSWTRISCHPTPKPK